MKIMQEHPQYKITPDQGWSQMQPILDKALPVEYRSRRFIVFWWVTAAAIIVAISSVILLKEKILPVILPPITSPSTEMTSSENKKSTDENQSISSPSSMPDENNSSEKVDDKNSNLQGKGNKETTSSSSTKILNSNFSSKSNIENKSNKQDNIVSAVQQVGPGIIVHQVDVVENETGGLDDGDLLTSNQIQTINRIPVGTNEINTIERSISSVGFLPLVDVMEYEYTQRNIGLIEPGIYSSSFHRRPLFIPNVSVGGIVGSQNGLGTNAGIGTDYAITSRLSVTGSVGFRSYRPDVLNLGNSDSYAFNEASNAILKNNYLDGEKVNASADYNAINPFIHTIRQWQVSAGLKYAFTRRFFIEGGIALGFGTTTKSEYPILTYGSFTSSADANIASSFDSYDVIRSNMTSVYGGLGYRMSRHFNIYAQWTHGLDHYILNDQLSAIESTPKRSDYIRGLNVGVRYQL